MDNKRKKRFLIIWLILCLDTLHFFAQEIKYGINNYITYQVGDIPLVISVPHGGALAPSSIPDRTCPNAVTVTDLNTQNIAKELSISIFNLTGCYPHIVYCNLKRSKLDCNRNVTDGTCEFPESMTAWQEYHGFLKEALLNADNEHIYNTFLLDIHGHGKANQRIELGYLLDEQDLENTDLVLNTSALINSSSIKNLAFQNKNNLKHADLIRGPLSFGTLLHDKGYPTVPSSQIPSPGGDNTYYNGGYITSNYTSYNQQISANGFQIELNYTGIRNNSENIKKFASDLAVVILEYMHTHRDIAKKSCQPASIVPSEFEISEIWYRPESHSICFSGNEIYDLEYQIYHYDGKLISSGKTISAVIELSNEMRSGLYIMQLRQRDGMLIKAFKFVID